VGGARRYARASHRGVSGGGGSARARRRFGPRRVRSLARLASRRPPSRAASRL